MNGKTWRRIARNLADGNNYREVAVFSLAAATVFGLIMFMVSSLGVLFLIGRIGESANPDDIMLLGFILGLVVFPLAGWIAYGFRKFVLALGLSAYPLAAVALLVFSAAA